MVPEALFLDNFIARSIGYSLNFLDNFPEADAAIDLRQWYINVQVFVCFAGC